MSKKLCAHRRIPELVFGNFSFSIFVSFISILIKLYLPIMQSEPKPESVQLRCIMLVEKTSAIGNI